MVINTYEIPVCSYHMLRLLHGNDIVINTYEILVYSQHVTVVVWRCTICTISSYELGTILCLIVTVNMEFYIIEIITRKFVFWHHLFRYSFSFFSFLLTLHFGFLSVSTYLLRLCALQIYSPYTICRSFLVLNWDPHACCGQDMLFYSCYTGKQILIIVLNKMPSF